MYATLKTWATSTQPDLRHLAQKLSISPLTVISTTIAQAFSNAFTFTSSISNDPFVGIGARPKLYDTT
jgi:hypothetical protein